MEPRGNDPVVMSSPPDGRPLGLTEGERRALSLSVPMGRRYARMADALTERSPAGLKIRQHGGCARAQDVVL